MRPEMLAVWWGYVSAALLGIPVLFMLRDFADRHARRIARRLRRTAELERELGLGDEALVQRVYGARHD